MSAPESLYPRLEPLLARVAKPVQYVGGEANAVVKAWDETGVRWALSYPDLYEVGQPNQGLAILYEVLNGQDWIAAERAYAVEGDLAALLREHGVPLFTLESHRAVRACDVWGVSLSTEMGYTNLLEMLDLAGVPLHAAERGEDDPLVVAGGHCAVNPEPLADFLDVVVLGDGERAVLELSALVRDWKAAGRPGGREGLLLEAARTGVFYVPGFYAPTYGDDGALTSVVPRRPGVPARVRRHVLTDLDAWAYPARPVVPLAETVHERYSAELFRGCTRGCRFCQAGFITRPVRERSVGRLAAMAADGLAATGYDEISLLSLSSADYSCASELVSGLADAYEGTSVSLSLPSTRVDAFTVELAEQVARNGRRTGLTFAPEAGTERLRAVINKNVSEDDLIATVTAAFGQGWRSVKLYFMCGLPSETDEDVLAIAGLAHRVIETGRRVAGRRDIACTVSLGAFIPKPDTPFQWAGQAALDVIEARMRALRAAIREDRSCGRAITARFADARPGRVEGLLCRGDRRVGAVIEAAWRAGARFDGWSEHFSYERWEAACRDVLEPQGLGLAWYTTRERPREEVLPWDHLDVGVGRSWLWRDYQAGLAAKPVPDCRWDRCSGCRVCPAYHVDNELATGGGRSASPSTGPAGIVPDSASTRAESVPHDSVEPRRGRRQPEQRPPAVQRLRVRYAKVGPLRFASHRDIARTLERAVRRAGLPIAYSSGFSPHPRLSHVNAAPTGAASLAEYVEIGLVEPLSPAKVWARLGEALPEGLPVTGVVVAPPGESLAGMLDASLWRIELGPVDPAVLEAALARLRAGECSEVVRTSGRGERRLDVAGALRAASVEASWNAGTVPAFHDGTVPVLTVLLAHGQPLVRPEDVVTALAALDPRLGGAEPPRCTRLAQGRLVTPDGGPAAGVVLTLADAALCLPPGEDDPRGARSGGSGLSC